MSNLTEILVPDIGGAKDVDVIELLVKPGDTVTAEQSLITLEGDKATMEIPSPAAGVVRQMKVKVGDKVSQGSLILVLEGQEAVAGKSQAEAEKPTPSLTPSPEGRGDAPKPSSEKLAFPPARGAGGEGAKDTSMHPTGEPHASPSVRRIAREFGVDLTRVRGTGEKNRILKEDIQRYVKSELSRGPSSGGIFPSPAPTIDFSQFGSIEHKPLNKIKKLTGTNLHRSWVTVPHVTQFGQADITEMEEFRNRHKAEAEKQGIKLTPLVFIMKAVVAALKAYPQFNASLDGSGEQLILKKYFHIGVAVDTPNGLVVPVIRDVDKKGLFALAQELGKISVKARDKGLSLIDIQGGCFTISSLGGIGGTAFTPIVNAPEVAILGVSKASIQPVYQDNTFVPRLMLPLSLSYDHRVVDGADGARFMVYLAECLSEIGALLL